MLFREYGAALNNLPQAPPEGVLYPIQLHMNLMEPISACITLTLQRFN
jgi:hypothetical protein